MGTFDPIGTVPSPFVGAFWAEGAFWMELSFPEKGTSGGKDTSAKAFCTASISSTRITLAFVSAGTYAHLFHEVLLAKAPVVEMFEAHSSAPQLPFCPQNR